MGSSQPCQRARQALCERDHTAVLSGRVHHDPKEEHYRAVFARSARQYQVREALAVSRREADLPPLGVARHPLLGFDGDRGQHLRDEQAVRTAARPAV